jgi:hypothetical protein
MPIYDKRQKSGMPMNPDRAEKLSQEIGLGPYIAVVESNADYTKHGSLQVTIQGNEDDTRELVQNRISVRMLYPYYSVKEFINAGQDPQRFLDTQQAHGMIFPAPQIGTKGLVMFLNKSIKQGVWMGAFQEQTLNHSIPEPATSTKIAIDNETARYYANGEYGLPVDNVVKSANIGQTTPDRVRHPVHPMADVLRKQGLLVDNIRGLTSSSQRRDAVNQIFGVKTPGRYIGDEKLVGPKTNAIKTKVTQPGGHSLTMDDGAIDGSNNLVRLRTQAGHQILLHDTNDLIYIGNAKGTAWIELTSDGKMDVFCEDSISMRTRGDFNFYADRDFNLEAKRNVNIRAKNILKTESNHARQLVNGSHRLEVKGNSDIKSLNQRIDTNDLSINTNNIDIANRIDTTITSGNFDLHTQLGIRQTAGTSINIKANSAPTIAETFDPNEIYSTGYTVTYLNENNELKFYQANKRTQVASTLEVTTPDNTEYWTEFQGPQHKLLCDNGKINISTTLHDVNIETLGANINIETDKIVYVDGPDAVHLNLPGPGAFTAIGSNDAAPPASRFVKHFGVHTHTEKSDQAKWEQYNYYNAGTFTSMIKRIPTHEPYDFHEDQTKITSSKAETDREA